MKRGLPNRGDFVTAQNGNLVMTVWQDTKAICCASTNSDPNTTQTITRKQKDGSVLNVNCPESIVSYNAKIGGVDRNDQLRGYYSIKLKSRKNYMYLFLLQSTSQLPIPLSSQFFPDLRKENVKDFRLALANLLIGEYNSRKRRGHPSLQQPIKRFCTAHFPVKAERKGNRCYYCYNYLNRRRETVWHCKDCDKFLCHTGKDDDCFYVYHTTVGPQ